MGGRILTVRLAIVLGFLPLCASPSAAHNPGSVEIAQCTEILKDDPDDVPTRRKRAELYVAFGDYLDAIKDCEHMLKVKPRAPWILVLRGRAHAVGMEFKKAVVDFSRAMELGDKTQVPLLLRASAYKDMGDLGRAVEDLSAALEVEKQYAIYYDRGELYLKLGEHRKALADFETFLKVQPSSVLFENLAKAALGAGELDKALDYANRAVEKTQRYAWNYLLRGRIHKKRGEKDEAAADLGTALARINEAVESEYGPSAFDLAFRAEIHVEMGFPARALEDLHEAIDLEEEAPALYRKRAAVLALLGKKQDAAKDLAKAKALQKKLDEEVLERLRKQAGIGEKKK
jgi:tetratricopeptide (TPR) repeat protein